jgi:hypothetical protein
MSEETELNPSPAKIKEEMVKIMASVRERGKDLSKSSLENTKPDLAAKALWMLSQGANFTKVREITGLSHECVRRLEWEHSANNITFAEQRKLFSSRYAMAAMEYTDLLFKRAEQLHDDPALLAQVSPEKLATVVGIMQDKSAMLAGTNNADINAKAGLSIEDARALIEAAAGRIAQKRNGTDKIVEAEVVNA